MSDLISRSELYDQLANKLTWLMKYGDDVYLAVGSDIREVIYNMPTAYSVDKVVEELKKSSKWVNETNEYGDDDGNDYIPLSKAIEIVKQGSVSDDVCEWNGEQSRLVTFTRFTTTCGDNIDLQTNSELLKAFRYCPFCGRKLKIVGD